MSPISSFQRHFSQITEKVPGLGDSITDAVVIEILKQPGEYVQADETYLILETDKVSVDIRATQAGVIVSYAAAEDDTVQVGDAIAVIDTSASPPEGAAATPKAASTPEAAAPAAPKAAPAAAPAAPAAAAAPAAPSVTPSGSPSRKETSVPLSRMRLTIAKRLKDSQNTAASLTTFNEIDMHNLMAMRSQYKEEFEKKHGVKLGFMSAFVKASSNALVRAPAVNGLFDIENKCITYRDFVDISVAVATPTGLVVPVLRNCESMSFAGIEGAIGDLGRRARAGQIAMEDMAGGTFTISNGGVYGSLFGTPILNPPQSAILGMHGIFKRPVVVNGEVQIRPMMYVALTYDHRIIDGGDAVTFLKDIKQQIEDPSRMLLEL